MSEITDRIAAALADHPNGMTAKELAAKLNWDSVRASYNMGRMFFAGELDRICVFESPTRRKNEYIYTVKAKVEATPKWVSRLAAQADRLAEGEIV